MKTKINHYIAVFLPTIRLITSPKSTASKASAWPRPFRTLLLCAVAAVLWALPATMNAQLGYPITNVPLGSNTTVLPDAPPPGNTMSIHVSVTTFHNFKGLLDADPATGVVRITNAHPAAPFHVFVTALDSAGIPILPTKEFWLDVTTPAACDPIDPLTFAPKVDLPAGTNPRSVAIGDFNGDHVQDLAIAAAPDIVKVLIGKTDGTFPNAASPPVTVGNTPNCVAVGDFDGDGNQDLATANSGSADVSILLGNGDGSFSNATSVGVDVLPRSVAVGDFNGDNKQDLVVTNEFQSLVASVSVLLGDGAGGFPSRTDLPVGAGVAPYWVAVGDFNEGFGDGKQDLAVTTRTPDNKVLIFHNTTPPGCLNPMCLATFATPVPLAVVSDPLSIAVGDFDGGFFGGGNGLQDLVTANQGAPSALGMSVLLHRFSGFQPHTDYPAGTFPQSVAVGDFDNSKRQDVVVANGGSNNVSVLLGNSVGTFPVPPMPFPTGLRPNSVAVGDFNRDGKQDLAVANFDSNDVSILLGKCPCGGTFSENFDVPPSLPPALPPGWVATPGGSWVTSNVAPDTMPNDASVDDPATISDKSLDTPGIAITSPTTQICFRNNYNLENTYDGGVLEISVSGGPFTDIISAGGTFVTGGYNAEINGDYGNPLAGRMAWSGNSCCYICTVVNLPASVNGQTIKLRFRMGSDNSVGGTGWRIDTIQVSPTATSCCCPDAPGLMKPRSGFINLSTRLRVGTGDNVGIGGFIVTGSDPKRVLVRAIGPSLAQFGVPDPLADPVLELHGPATFATITNNNWRDTQEAEILATGIPPTNNLESAIVATLAPGAYSGIVRGNNNTSGVALIEVYDLDQEALSGLANISTRALVGAADNIVIAGFTLGAGDDARIVVRGIGPSLTAVGVPNALADPTLELRDGNGTLLIANNDWQDDPVQVAELTAAGLAPTNNLEAGIAGTLPPGIYTALLAGRNNGTGIGLVEVYIRDITDSATIASSGPCLSP